MERSSLAEARQSLWGGLLAPELKVRLWAELQWTGSPCWAAVARAAVWQPRPDQCIRAPSASRQGPISRNARAIDRAPSLTECR